VNTYPKNSFVGIFLSVGASVLFAVLYYYTTILEPLSAMEIYAWRVILTAPILGFFLFIIGKHQDVLKIFLRVVKQPIFILYLILSAALLGVQLWVFMWAPSHGYALDVSLGFFLLPLTMAMTGRFIFKEKITSWQLIACAIALIGVCNEIFVAQHLAWPAFVVCLGYPVYFALRRIFNTNNLGGMWVDMALSLPLGVAIISGGSGANALDIYTPSLIWLIIVLGLISSGGLACMILASSKLSMTVFGLLNYIEPILLVLVALVLGERIANNSWVTYSCIWLAVFLLVIEGVIALRRRQPVPTSP
jgi:chloramphenicol-sensitive protein RarD